MAIEVYRLCSSDAVQCQQLLGVVYHTDTQNLCKWGDKAPQQVAEYKPGSFLGKLPLIPRIQTDFHTPFA